MKKALCIALLLFAGCSVHLAPVNQTGSDPCACDKVQRLAEKRYHKGLGKKTKPDKAIRKRKYFFNAGKPAGAPNRRSNRLSIGFRRGITECETFR
jgi:hypothetical protein